MEKLELIFIGDHFYSESGSWMSSIYHLDGRRSDWGKVNVALREGRDVHIRPATDEELEHYEKQLVEIKGNYILDSLK